MLKDDRPDSPYGPRYLVAAANDSRELKISRNWVVGQLGLDRYFVEIDHVGEAFTEEQMLEFFAAFLAVRDSYEA